MFEKEKPLSKSKYNFWSIVHKYREGKGERECEIIIETECLQALNRLKIDGVPFV